MRPPSQFTNKMKRAAAAGAFTMVLLAADGTHPQDGTSLLPLPVASALKVEEGMQAKAESKSEVAQKAEAKTGAEQKAAASSKAESKTESQANVKTQAKSVASILAEAEQLAKQKNT